MALEFSETIRPRIRRIALHPAEEATLRAFVAADKRDRFLALFANAKRRRQACDSLNHFSGWDPRRVAEVASSTDLLAVLRAAGAPAVCHIIADDPALDGTDLPLADALIAAEACSFASVLCGLPGRIALFTDEIAARRTRILLRQKPR